MKSSRFAVPILLAVCLAAAPGVLAADSNVAAAAAPAPLAPETSAQPTPANASSEVTRVDPAEIAADVLVVRPVSFAATAIGAAIFVVALPFAAITKDVKRTGDILVGMPGRFTFTRKLGEFGMQR